MANEASSTASAFWQDLFSTGLYKRSQGRITRQVTFAAMAVIAVLAAWALYGYLSDKAAPFSRGLLMEDPPASMVGAERASYMEEKLRQQDLFDNVNFGFRAALPTVVLFGGVWLAFRVVNWPRFADFLIAVEAEMNKVSWPSRAEMIRSAVVVMITIFGLAFVLLAYDLIWQVLLRAIGVLPG